jgi:hypothetical protein
MAFLPFSHFSHNQTKPNQQQKKKKPQISFCILPSCCSRTSLATKPKERKPKSRFPRNNSMVTYPPLPLNFWQQLNHNTENNTPE